MTEPKKRQREAKLSRAMEYALRSILNPPTGRRPMNFRDATRVAFIFPRTLKGLAAKGLIELREADSMNDCWIYLTAAGEVEAKRSYDAELKRKKQLVAAASREP